MREYLFRGKRVDNGEWVEGMPCSDLKGGVDAIQSNLGGGIFDIYPESFGQYTGMKDKNGRKIFEGDIISINEDVKEMFNIRDGVVKYGWGGFHIGNFDHLSSLHAVAAFDCVLRGEVIGTVFENADLLEG
jgi:uncharacterized phage protein (TIGR01671 family)